MDIKVLGVRRAVENLSTMRDAIIKSVTRKAVRAATKVILAQVRRTTYGGDRQRQTGLLRRSLGMAVSARGDIVRGKIVMRRINITGKSKVAQLVRAKRKSTTQRDATAFYWRFLEKGTKERTTRSGAKRGAVRPSPWVVPAFDAKTSEAIDQFRLIFNRETENEARKLPKGVGP